MPTAMEQARILFCQRFMNILMAEFGTTQHNMILPDAATIDTFYDIGALRKFVFENPANPFPTANEWMSEIEVFKAEVLPNNDESALARDFDTLYVKFEDTEILQNRNIIAYQQKHDDHVHATEWNTMRQAWQNINHRCLDQFNKLLDPSVIEVDHDEINNGYNRRQQTLYIKYCFESLKNLLNGKYLCWSCMSSWAAKDQFKQHLKTKHRTEIDLVAQLASAQTQRQNREEVLIETNTGLNVVIRAQDRQISADDSLITRLRAQLDDSNAELQLARQHLVAVLANNGRAAI